MQPRATREELDDLDVVNDHNKIMTWSQISVENPHETSWNFVDKPQKRLMKVGKQRRNECWSFKKNDKIFPYEI